MTVTYFHPPNGQKVLRMPSDCGNGAKPVLIGRLLHDYQVASHQKAGHVKNIIAGLYMFGLGC
jgi:hypothetical protein